MISISEPGKWEAFLWDETEACHKAISSQGALLRGPLEKTELVTCNIHAIRLKKGDWVLRHLIARRPPWGVLDSGSMVIFFMQNIFDATNPKRVEVA